MTRLYFYLKLSVYLNNLYTENFTKTNMIKDVLYTRDLNDSILNIEELNFLINLLCTEKCIYSVFLSFVYSELY